MTEVFQDAVGVWPKVGGIPGAASDVPAGHGSRGAMPSHGEAMSDVTCFTANANVGRYKVRTAWPPAAAAPGTLASPQSDQP